MNKRSVGSGYEELAADFMQKKGMKILKKNYRCRLGEIDLIAKDDGYVVFAEVKYRRDHMSGSPADAVDYRKQQKICRVADFYRVSQRLSAAVPIRFDVIAVTGDEISWYKNAFDYIGSM